MLISNICTHKALKWNAYVTKDFVFSRNDIVLYENLEEMNFQLLLYIHIYKIIFKNIFEDNFNEFLKERIKRNLIFVSKQFFPFHIDMVAC